MITRRGLFEGAAAGAAWAGGNAMAAAAGNSGSGLTLAPALPAGTRGEAMLDTLAGKQPLIKLSFRPPNYEAPLDYLRTPITPNDRFFVRYHLSDIPEVDAKSWKLGIGGDGADGQAELTLDDLKAMPSAEVTAVCQCSGNRRGLFDPHVPGVEWGYGAMGCARWKGVRLKDVLDKVGVKKGTVEIVLDGADKGAVEQTPDFVKSLPLAKAMEDTTLIAYEMNGAPLPHWNGFPARVIVPGWTATYWMKHVTSVRAVMKPFDGFWMKSAYRIPVGKFPLVARFISQETDVNTPITEMVVNSLITSHADGATVKPGATATVGGLAWDGGYGIRVVEVSTDGGSSWVSASLGEDLGRFAFRPWSYGLAVKRGRNTVMVRATNIIGQSQTAALIANPAGYHHNVMQSVTLDGSLTMRHIAICAAVVLLAVPALVVPAVADESAIQLKPGAGRDKVEGNCGACHSLDYIQMNSPFMADATWDAEVTKMIKAFGAPIDDGDAKAIGDYLKQNYGAAPKS